LPLTLEEIYHGITKYPQYKRRIFDANGNEKQEYVKLQISIVPGTEEGTEFCFAHKGEQSSPKEPPSDAVFIVKEIPHNEFRRRGNDLFFSRKITKQQLQNTSVRQYITTLEKTLLKVDIMPTDDNYVHVTLIGHGLLSSFTLVKGNLIVEFLVVDE